MNIVLSNQTFLCENDMIAMNQLFQRIRQILEETGQSLINLVVDGEEVYTEFDQYIEEHLKSIQTITINAKTQQELLDDALLSIKEYLERAVLEIDKLVDQFYHEVTSETWNTFSQLLEGIQYIMKTLETVVMHENWYCNVKYFVQAKESLSQNISILQKALESQDRVWLSDVLIYEITPVFKLLCTVIEKNIEIHISTSEED